jgi:hypothetical protein
LLAFLRCVYPRALRLSALQAGEKGFSWRILRLRFEVDDGTFLDVLDAPAPQSAPRGMRSGCAAVGRWH